MSADAEVPGFKIDEFPQYEFEAQWAVRQVLVGAKEQRVEHALVAIAAAVLTLHQDLDFIGDQLEKIANR